MPANIKNQIQKLNYFKNNNLNIKDIIFLNDEMYKIVTDDDDFILRIFHENSLDKLKKLSIHNQSAIKTGSFDKNHYFEISKSDNLTNLEEYLKNHNEKENYKLGLRFGNLLKEIHTIVPEEKIIWFDFFNTKVNYLFYMHGIHENIGDDDYILIDYINHNRHLTKSIRQSYIFNNLDFNHIFVDKNENIIISGINFTKIGDGVYDFVKINNMALESKDFALGCFEGYFQNQKAPIKFFRLLALYEAYNILDNIVAHRQEKPSIYTKDDLQNLLKMYDNFNIDVPKWIKEGE